MKKPTQLRLPKVNLSSIKSRLSNLTKRQKIISIIIFSVAVILTTTLVILNNRDPVLTIYTILEPDAPLTTELLITDYAGSKKSIDATISNNSVISYAQDIPVETVETFLNTEKYIETIKYSPDNSKVIVLSWTSDPTQYKSGNPMATEIPTLNLSITDADGNLIKNLEDKDILSAEFTDNNQVYYQKLGDDFGIYAYTIDKDTNKKFIETSDPDFFKNIVMIDEDKYFFVQPKTGKYGYGTISTGELNIIGQKVVASSTILDTDMAAFSNVTISPDKQLLAFFDNSTTQNFNKNLLVFPSVEDKFETPTATAVVEQTVDDFGTLSNNFSWSEDGKLLTTGTDATTVNTDTKQVVFKGESGKFTKVKFSPDQSKVLNCTTGTQGSCNIKFLKEDKNNKKDSALSLPKDISDMEWLDDDKVVFVVGQNIYDYKVNAKKLEKVSNNKGNYKIVTKNNKDKKLVVKQDERLMEVRIK